VTGERAILRVSPTITFLIVAIIIVVSAIAVYIHAASFVAVLWSADGEWVAFSCGGLGPDRSEIFIMRPDGSNRQRITSQRIMASLPTWSPDGEWIAFVKDHSLYKVRPDGKDIQQILDNSSESAFDFSDTSPAWSPDGEWIAFVSNRVRVDEWDIYRVGADGGDLQRLTEGRNAYRSLAWSPEGDWIVFSANSLDHEGIYIIRPDGSEERALMDTSVRATDPSWSPDGGEIVFAIDNGRAINLYILSVDDGEIRRLTDEPSADSFPKWSPDGESVFFSASGANGYSQIYRIGADGDNREAITHMEDCHAIAPTWISFDR
jgi:TolB protein